MNEIEFHKLRYAWDKDYVDNLGHLEPKKEKKMNDEINMEEAGIPVVLSDEQRAALEEVVRVFPDEAPTAPEVLGYGQTSEGEVATATDVALV